MLLSCTGPVDDTAVDLGPPPVVEAEPATLRRLTETQYRNAVLDLLGGDLSTPSSLEPDTPVEGLLAIGAGQTSVSAWGWSATKPPPT